MRESRPYGSVRGARGNSRPYREWLIPDCDPQRTMASHGGGSAFGLWLPSSLIATASGPGVEQTAGGWPDSCL
jgi:hypothetical protein